MSEFKVNVDDSRDTPLVLELSGKLLTQDLKALQAAIDQQFEVQNYELVLDLSETESMLSSHLGAIYQRSQIAKQKGGKLALACPNEFIGTAIQRVGFQRVIEIHDDLASALASF